VLVLVFLEEALAAEVVSVPPQTVVTV